MRNIHSNYKLYSTIPLVPWTGVGFWLDPENTLWVPIGIRLNWPGAGVPVIVFPVIGENVPQSGTSQHTSLGSCFSVQIDGKLE